MIYDGVLYFNNSPVVIPNSETVVIKNVKKKSKKIGAKLFDINTSDYKKLTSNKRVEIIQLFDKLDEKILKKFNGIHRNYLMKEVAYKTNVRLMTVVIKQNELIINFDKSAKDYDTKNLLKERAGYQNQNISYSMCISKQTELNYVIKLFENLYNSKTDNSKELYIDNLLSDITTTILSIDKSIKKKKVNKGLMVFQFTFSWVGQPISDALDGFLGDTFMPYLSNLLSGTAPWFQSLLVDGIVAGVGGIIVLLPIILALFLCIAILEDSGYMARVAFLMDKFMRKIGLSGKAFLPMITGFGCTVPAIMSARTLESEKDRKLTALLAPFMSCNARLPVYVIFAGLFFPDNASMVVASLYILGILVAFILGLVFKNTLFKKDEEPFIIELPEYKVPEVRSVLAQLWDKSKSFLKKAGTIIFAMSVVIWFLQSFNFTGMVEDITHSFLYNIGSFIAPIFAPLGFGDWQASVSLLTGLMAKETIISTMEVIYKGDLTHMLPQFFTALSSYSFMVFVLLYTPCISVVGVMKKEYGGKFTILSVIFQFLVAWISAFIIYHIGLLIF